MSRPVMRRCMGHAQGRLVTVHARDPSPANARAPARASAAMRLAGAELLESREILPGQWLQAFHAPELVAGARAGQFVHVRTGDYSGLVLRRPFSFNTIDPVGGNLTIHFRTIGRGTEWFTRLRPGDRVHAGAVGSAVRGGSTDAARPADRRWPWHGRRTCPR